MEDGNSGREDLHGYKIIEEDEFIIYTVFKNVFDEYLCSNKYVCYLTIYFIICRGVN